MSRADEQEEQENRIAQTWGPEAVGRELAPIEEPDPAIGREAERQAREDELASLAMEIVMRARQRVGRTKWSTTEGVVKRKIVEALRCLAPDD
jgi:hypothetical protein